MGTDLNKYVNNVVEILLASSFATVIYQALIRKEQNDDSPEIKNYFLNSRGVTPVKRRNCLEK